MGGGTVTAIREVVGEGVQYLADLLGRIVSGIKSFAQVAPLMLAVGCENNAESATQRPAISAIEIGPVVETPANDAEPKTLGKFNMTFYYVVGEVDVMRKLAKKQAANSNAAGTELATVAPAPAQEMVTLFHGKGCKPVAEVTKEYAAQLTLQGTGKLKDGRVLNVWGPCGCDYSPCFKETETKWGTGGTGRALQPFRTVAVDPNVVKLGSLLYIPELEGRTMPGRAPWGGYVHDGCVVADDTGGGIKGKQLDLFVGRKTAVDLLSSKGGSHRWARNVAVLDGGKLCERKGRRVGRKTAAI